MNKQLSKDLSQELVDKFELDKKQANSFVEKMFSVLQDGLQDEKIVKIKGLGTFKVISVQSRKSIDVNTGEPILIDGRDKISFTPDSDMRDFVNRPFSQFETVVVNEGTDFSPIDKKFAEEEKEETLEDSAEDNRDHSLADQKEDAPKDQQQENSIEDKQEKTLETRQESVSQDEIQRLTEEELSDASDTSLHKDNLSETSSTEEIAPKQETPLNEANAPVQETSSLIDAAINQNIDEPKDEKETLEHTTTQASNGVDQDSKEIGQKDKEQKTEDQEAHAAEIEQEVHAATVSINRQFEDENHQLQVANEELRNNFRHQYRMMKGVITVFVLVVLLCLGGGYFLLNQLKKRDHRIEMLEILAYRNKNGINAQNGNDSTLSTAPSATSQQSQNTQTTKENKALDNAENETRAESRRVTANSSSQPSGSATTGCNQSDNDQRNASKPASNVNNTKQKPSDIASSKEADKEQTAYNKDVRIRTGAYRIVGISHTVKVRSGQTLSSISRANLGPGMECYVQAVNGGKTDFKAGENVKIPKLQIKKRK